MESDGDESTSQQADACPICLGAFVVKTLVANPNECKHIFCPECINEWSKKTNTCPVDRTEFVSIRIKRLVSVHPTLQFSKCLRTIPVDKRRIDDAEQDATFCEICGRSDREHTLLLCDDCDNGFHCECLDPPLHEIPEGFWFCDGCIERRERLTTMTDDPVQDVVNAIAESAANPTTSRPRPVARRRKVVKRGRKKAKRRVKTRKSFAKTTSKKYKRLRRKKPPVVRKTKKKKSALIDQMPIEAPILVEMLSKKEKAPAESISDIKAINFGQDKAWFTLTNLMNEVPITSLEAEPKRVAEPVKKDPSDSVLLLDKILEEQSRLFGKPKLTSSFKMPVQNKTPVSSTNVSFNRHFRLTEKERPCTSGLSSSKSFSPDHDVQKPVQVTKTFSLPLTNNKAKDEPKIHETSADQPKSTSLKLEPKSASVLTKSQGSGHHRPKDDCCKARLKSEPMEDGSDCVQPKPSPKVPQHRHSSDVKRSVKHEPTSPEKAQVRPKLDSAHHHESPPVKHTGSTSHSVQDQIVEIAKNEIKPYYLDRKINKDQYKIVMKKVVKLALHDAGKEFGSAQEAKVRGMVHHYVKKFF